MKSCFSAYCKLCICCNCNGLLTPWSLLCLINYLLMQSDPLINYTLSVHVAFIQKRTKHLISLKLLYNVYAYTTYL